MNKIALITDTTADLTKDFINKNNIHVLSFRIIYKDGEYRDGVEITSKEVYDNLHKEIPTSSLPSVEDIEKLYTNLENQGYTHVIAITLSSGLSGISNTLKLVSEEHPKIVSHICDSKSISAGEGIIVEECAKMIDAQESFEKIVNSIPSIIKRIQVFFIVDTLEYLIKGGRIGKVSGKIGKILNIKPIISIEENGKYYTYDKVRGKKQAFNRLVEIITKITNDSKCSVCISHGNGLEDAKKMLETLSQLPNVTDIRFTGEISPVSGMHSGPGLLGITLFKQNQ